MRYDAAEHLEAWRKHGTFPKIHDAIANMAMQEMTSRRVLDLGCSHGLLGARLLAPGVNRIADIVVGIDVNVAAVEAGMAAGVPIAFNHLKVERETFPDVLALVKAHRLNVVLARRILPEMFGHDIEAGTMFAHLLARAGVKELIIEGRINTLSATNPLKSIVQEVCMVDVPFREARRIGAVSYLVAR